MRVIVFGLIVLIVSLLAGCDEEGDEAIELEFRSLGIRMYEVERSDHLADFAERDLHDWVRMELEARGRKISSLLLEESVDLKGVDSERGRVFVEVSAATEEFIAALDEVLPLAVVQAAKQSVMLQNFR